MLCQRAKRADYTKSWIEAGNTRLRSQNFLKIRGFIIAGSNQHELVRHLSRANRENDCLPLPFCISPPSGLALRIDSSIKALSRVSKVHVYCRTNYNLASIGGPGTLKFYERYAQKCYLAPVEFPTGTCPRKL